MSLQQGFASTGMGPRHHFAEQQFGRPKCRKGSKATISTPWCDVRFTPNNDRDSELPGGRLVPTAGTHLGGLFLPAAPNCRIETTPRRNRERIATNMGLEGRRRAGFLPPPHAWVAPDNASQRKHVRGHLYHRVGASSIMPIEIYKAYLIETFESSVGRYRARVRRLDGQNIKNLTDGSRETESVPTSGIEAFSEDGALRLAKEMIIRGEMK